MFSGLRMGLAQEERCEALKVVVQSLLVVGPEVYALVSCARGTQPPGELLLASCAIPKTSTREGGDDLSQFRCGSVDAMSRCVRRDGIALRGMRS